MYFEDYLSKMGSHLFDLKPAAEEASRRRGPYQQRDSIFVNLTNFVFSLLKITFKGGAENK